MVNFQKACIDVLENNSKYERRDDIENKYKDELQKIKKPYQIPIQNPEELKQVFNKLDEDGLSSEKDRIKKILKKGYMTRLNKDGNIVADFTNMGSTNKIYNKNRVIRDKKRYDNEVIRLREKIMREI